MRDDADQLTVLTTLGVNAVKTFRRMPDGEIESESYGKARTFTAATIAVDDRGEWLEKLRKKRHSFVVLGRPKDWKKGEKKRRLSQSRDGDDATIEDVPRRWMPVDIDQIDFAPLLGFSCGEAFAHELLDRLGLRGVKCVWHLTNSHGFSGKYRARLWVALSTPADCEQMRTWAKGRWGDEVVDVDGKPKALVDLAVYRPAQPIYTGDPILEGIDDPCEQRVGWIDGDGLELKGVAKASGERRARKRGAPEDANVTKLQEAGLYIRRLRPGQHCVVCPWEDAHSGEARDDDTFYFEPHFNGHDVPAFKCHHGSCEQRRWVDVLAAMGEQAGPGEGEGDDEERAPNWVYVHRLKCFWDARDGAMIERESYDSTHGGRTKRGTPTERFLAMRRSQKADAAEFMPGLPRFVVRGRVRVLNTYIDQRMEPDLSVDPTPWVEHLTWLIPNERDRERLMDWLAWVYQYPGRKITWAPILYGQSHGTGKTTVFNCLAHCVGPSLVSEPTQAELEDKFNDWCYGKLLVKIEELMSGDKFHVAEKLKPVVANPTVSIRAMHRTGFTASNTANVCASTNHMQALPIESNDRRYMLIDTVEADEETRRPRMRAFHQWLEDVGYGGVAAWLAERDVSEFVPTDEAPATRLKALVAESSKTDFDRAVDLCDVFDDTGVITSAMLMEYLQTNDCHVKTQRLGLIAARRKWRSLPGREGRIFVGGKKVTLWTGGRNVLLLRQFMAKKPDERDRLHASMMAGLFFAKLPAGKGA